MRRKDREITDQKKIVEILDQAKVCRLGIHNKEEIYIVPMNFGYTFIDNGLTLFFHCAHRGLKIELLKENNSVGFEIDTNHKLIVSEKACEHSFSYSSIIGAAKAYFIEPYEEKASALKCIMKHQTGKEFNFNENQTKAVCLFKIVVEKFCCKANER